MLSFLFGNKKAVIDFHNEEHLLDSAYLPKVNKYSMEI